MKGPLADVRKFHTTRSPLKIMKDDFCFMLKALFVLEIFMFMSWLFDYVEKRLNKKVIPKCMASQSGQQMIKIHISPNIWRSKDNQAMGLSQLIEHNLQNIIL